MSKAFFLMGVCMLLADAGFAQQTFTVTDVKPAMVNGLQMGFSIRSKEEKEVGDKGKFSRYALRFYITNTTSEAKIILYKQGLNLLGNISDQLVQFNCLNATGARLTTRSAILNAAPCNVTALVDDNDCGTKKTVKNKRFVQIGYWIQAGQTISTDGIVIVPLNEQPNVQAAFLASTLQPMASASIGSYQQDAPQLTGNEIFSRIRYLRDNTYLNVETGILRTSSIQNGWWSAEWQIIHVPGSNYINIKNHWKGHYVGEEHGGLSMMTDPGISLGGSWIMEPAQGSAYRLKNAETGTYLSIINNQISLSADYNAAWAIE